MTQAYEEILELLPPEPKERGRMPLRDRAAQFAPFAALTGYEDSLMEALMPAFDRIELGEDDANGINEALLKLKGEKRNSLVTVTHYVENVHREGGLYVDHTANVERVDEIVNTLDLTGGLKVPFRDILHLRIND